MTIQSLLKLSVHSYSLLSPSQLDYAAARQGNFFSGSSVNLKTPALILSAFLRVVGPLRACIGPKDALGLPAPARPAISAISSKVLGKRPRTLFFFYRYDVSGMY